jgi:hypothetical protein
MYFFLLNGCNLDEVILPERTCLAFYVIDLRTSRSGAIFILVGILGNTTQ